MFLTGKRSPFLGEMKNSVVNVFPGNFTTSMRLKDRGLPFFGSHVCLYEI